MDIPRGKEVFRRRMIKRILLVIAGVAAIGGTTFALTRLKPAAPTVDMSTLWPDTVKRGPIVIQVRGLGRLTPQDILWKSAAFDSRVERIYHRAGAQLKANDVILVLSNADM